MDNVGILIGTARDGVTPWEGDVTPTLNSSNRVSLPESSIGLQHIPRGAVSFKEMNMGCVWGGAFLNISWPQEKQGTPIQAELSRSPSPLVCIVQQESHTNEKQGSVTHPVPPTSEAVRLPTVPALSTAPSYRAWGWGMRVGTS